MDFFIPLIIVLLSIFIGRLVNEKSYKLLTTEKKSHLIDIFSKYRIYGFVIVIIIIAILFLLPYFNILNYSYSLILYILLLIGYFIGTSIFSYKKLKQNDYPIDFIKLYIISILIRFSGIAIFFVFLILKNKVFQ